MGGGSTRASVSLEPRQRRGEGDCRDDPLSASAVPAVQPARAIVGTLRATALRTPSSLWRLRGLRGRGLGPFAPRSAARFGAQSWKVLEHLQSPRAACGDSLRRPACAPPPPRRAFVRRGSPAAGPGRAPGGTSAVGLGRRRRTSGSGAVRRRFRAVLPAGCPAAAGRGRARAEVSAPAPPGGFGRLRRRDPPRPRRFTGDGPSPSPRSPFSAGSPSLHQPRELLQVRPVIDSMSAVASNPARLSRFRAACRPKPFQHVRSDRPVARPRGARHGPDPRLGTRVGGHRHRARAAAPRKTVEPLSERPQQPAPAAVGAGFSNSGWKHGERAEPHPCRRSAPRASWSSAFTSVAIVATRKMPRLPPCGKAKPSPAQAARKSSRQLQERLEYSLGELAVV